MKRAILPVFLLTIGLFLVVQYSFAGIGAGCGKGCKGQNNQGQQQTMDAETKGNYEKFMEETVDLRKELVEKAAEYQALMASENSDPAKAALITEEYFQLRDFLTDKAVKAGIVQKSGGCNGCSGKQGVACGLSGPGANIEKTN
jgi:hypothetical protein